MISIRQRKKIDIDTIVGWVPDAAALYLFTGSRLTWPLSTKKLSEMESDQNFSAWIGASSSDGKPVGHFDLTQYGETFRIGRVIIDPAQRGQGLAGILVALAVAKAQALGASRITLNVIAGNSPAIHTYERIGFRTAPTSTEPSVLAMEFLLG
ncbi:MULTISPECIES: GNAT family N-acetyltransferase [Arthrobacter]|uniref:GNAT family N-acetyltransferase n=1 Tax=Arthrobacter TaxID=1663 RepID=UPI0033954862